MYIQSTLTPYKILPHEGIQYSVCREYDHISRHKGLRQIIHQPQNIDDRMITLETPNSFAETNLSFRYHDVLPKEENRLDVVAYEYLGSASYGWVIAYYNGIDDGYTLRPGQRIRIPDNVTSLMKSGEVLQSVTALQLNLGSE